MILSKTSVNLIIYINTHSHQWVEQGVEHNGGACCSLHNKGKEGGYRYYHGSLQSVSEELDKEEIPADVHATGLGGQNASKLAKNGSLRNGI